MEPILTYSEITGSVYIVTKYRRLDGGVIDAREKYDVTKWVESYAKKRNAQTVEENAKLRELVKALDWCTENTDLRSRCDECPLKQSDTLEPECEVWMRELGIKEENDEQEV